MKKKILNKISIVHGEKLSLNFLPNYFVVI